jgi:hypothetical protein
MGTVYVDNKAAERTPYRGGSWGYASGAGLGFCGLRYPRSDSVDGLGFFSAYQL